MICICLHYCELCFLIYEAGNCIVTIGQSEQKCSEGIESNVTKGQNGNRVLRDEVDSLNGYLWWKIRKE
jgi:hypothetical protein